VKRFDVNTGALQGGVEIDSTLVFVLPFIKKGFFTCDVRMILPKFCERCHISDSSPCVKTYRVGVERHPRVGGAREVRDTPSGRSGEAVSLERSDGRRFAPDSTRSTQLRPDGRREAPTID
jgi:hypothetical protein